DPEESTTALEDRESTMLRAAIAAEVAGQPSQAPLEDQTARVLVVDDDDATRDLVASTLRASGYEVETAEDGQAAIERVARGGLDVILLDAVMPRVSGVEARSEEHTSELQSAE